MASVINDNIKRTAMGLIELKLKDTVLNLVYDMCELSTLEPDKDIPKPITNYIEDIKRHAANLPEILSHDLEDRSELINELYAIRADYERICRPITFYMRLADMAGSYGMWMYECKSSESLPLENYDRLESPMRAFISEYIDDSEDDNERYEKISSVLSRIPLRMTKERYYDILRKSLRHYFTDMTRADAEYVTYTLKTQYCPISMPGYGSIMPDIKQAAEELYSRPLENLSVSELEDYMGEVDSFGTDLAETADYINISYNDINYLIAIATFCIDEDYLTKDDPVMRDIIYTCRSMLQNNEAELYAESLTEKTETEIEECFELMRPMDKKLIKYVSKYGESKHMDDESYDIIGVYLKIQELYRREFSSIMFNSESDDYEVISAQEANDRAEEIVSFMLSAPENILPRKNKFLRRSVLEDIPIVMSANEFNAYLDYALEAVRGKGTGAACLTEIYNLLSDEGIIPDPEEEDEPHSHEHCHHDHDHEHCHHDHDHEHCHHDHEHCHHDHEHCHHDHDHDHGCGCGHPHLHVVKHDKD